MRCADCCLKKKKQEEKNRTEINEITSTMWKILDDRYRRVFKYKRRNAFVHTFFSLRNLRA